MHIAYDAAYAPNLGTVHGKGAIAVNHYLTGIYASTSAQPVDAHKHGLGSIITYEQGPSELIGLSRAGGREVGRRILAAVKKLGAPLDGTVAVYPSVDVNVATARMDSCDPAYRGLRDVLAGRLSIRCYGEYDLIKHLHDQHLTDGPGWLAGATSWSAGDHSGSPLVCMVQHVGSDIPSTDRNTVTQPQALGAWWPAGSPFLKEDDMANSDDILAEVKALRAEVGMTGKQGSDKKPLTVYKFLHDIFSLPGADKQLHQYSFDTLIGRRTNPILAAVRAQANPAEIAAAVVAALPKGTTGALTEGDVEAAVRKVFADAGDES